MHFYRLETLVFLLGSFLSVGFMSCTSQTVPEDQMSGEQGGSDLLIQLPVSAGKELLCTQGAFGSYSHTSVSTQYDIDLDTDNTSNEEIFAPVNGTVFVHTESATSGFGYHINIDVGNEHYVVIAHLSEIFLIDGQEVASGQLIGYEGCTGDCSGDHIHIGLHQGDAAQAAQYGTSVPASYWAANASERTGFEEIVSEAFVCGVQTDNSSHDGNFYESDLPVTLWHPNGVLVKTPDNARVYVLEDGRLRWMENEDIFWSFHYDFEDLLLISRQEFECLGEGEQIDDPGYINAFFDTQQQLWLIVGSSTDPNRYRARVNMKGWESVMASWGLPYDSVNTPETYSQTSGYFTDWPVSSNIAGLRDGTFVKEEDASDVYVISDNLALPVQSWDVYLLMNAFAHSLLTVEDGLVGELHSVGSCATDNGCLDAVAITTCGGGMDISGGESGGSPTSETPSEQPTPEDSPQPQPTQTPVTSEQTPEPSPDDPVEEIPGVLEDPCEGQAACLVDQNNDGLAEMLFMAQDLWLASSIEGIPSYVYGNGGCFDGVLTSQDLVLANDFGYYEIDFSDVSRSCSVQLTLISSEGTDGKDPAADMSNWYWWQNASLCSMGSSLCELMDNGTAWEEWLIAVSWNLEAGLTANGNGFTDNNQL